MLDPPLKLCKAIMVPFGITVLDSLNYHFKPQRKTFPEQKKEHRWAPLDTQRVGDPVCAPLWSSQWGKHSTEYELPVLCSGEEENREGRTAPYLKTIEARRAEAQQTWGIASENSGYFTRACGSLVLRQSKAIALKVFLKLQLKKSVLVTGFSPDLCTCTHWGNRVNWLYSQKTNPYTRQSEEI